MTQTTDSNASRRGVGVAKLRNLTWSPNALAFGTATRSLNFKQLTQRPRHFDFVICGDLVNFAVVMNECTPHNPFLERHKEILMDLSGVLPHWHQEGKIQYVTFRLNDSLPQNKIIELKNQKAAFELANPQPWDSTTASRFHQLISPYESELLDHGYGDCILRNQTVRNELTSVLSKFDRDRYRIIAYVVMPNHVHLLSMMLGENRIDETMSQIWQHSTVRINRIIGKSGAIWVKNFFDRIVRSHEHLKHCVNYIRHNPRNLPKEDYSLYINQELVDGYGNWIG